MTEPGTVKESMIGAHNVYMTNEPGMTPESLRAAGYRYKGSFGRVQMWVHPNGEEEIWLFPRSDKEQPAEPEGGEEGGEPESIEDPVLEIATEIANHLSAQPARLRADAARCKRLVGTPEYQACFTDLITALNDFDNGLRRAKNAFPDWDADVDPKHQWDLEEQKDRILGQIDDFSDLNVEIYNNLPSP
jgi:hypothetical protein